MLYDKLLSLPFVMKEEIFNQIIEGAENSSFLSENQKKYLNNKISYRENWAKCLIKKEFAAGLSTTSRIEGLHSVLKRYLTSNSCLQNIFIAFVL